MTDIRAAESLPTRFCFNKADFKHLAWSVVHNGPVLVTDDERDNYCNQCKNCGYYYSGIEGSVHVHKIGHFCSEFCYEMHFKEFNMENENGESKIRSLTNSEIRAYKMLTSLGFNNIKRKGHGTDFIITNYIDTPVEVKSNILSDLQVKDFTKAKSGMLIIVNKKNIMIFELRSIHNPNREGFDE